MALYPVAHLALLVFGVFLLRRGVARAPVADVEAVEAPAASRSAEVCAGSYVSVPPCRRAILWRVRGPCFGGRA